MPDVSIKYKNAEIASMSASGSKTLKTAGSYVESDIVVNYIKPQTEVIGSGRELTSLVCASKTAAGHFFGDVNGDGVIDQNDVDIIAGYTTGAPIGDAEAADVSGDGSVSNNDLINVARAVENNQMFVKITASFDDGSSESAIQAVDMPAAAGFVLPVFEKAEQLEFTLTTAINASGNTVELEHNLGEVPDFILLWPKENATPPTKGSNYKSTRLLFYSSVIKSGNNTSNIHFAMVVYYSSSSSTSMTAQFLQITSASYGIKTRAADKVVITIPASGSRLETGDYIAIVAKTKEG